MERSMPGGFEPIEPATEEVQLICDKVSSAFVNIISLALGALSDFYTPYWSVWH